ncbi:NYN domain-containing protein [Micromonospora sp. LOL_024]|uniref:NYN domain-containing protein n=1 Tax=Micromonospora sp. LOL_024 TaxID=3345412 RepID=UPI003A8BA83E
MHRLHAYTFGLDEKLGVGLGDPVCPGTVTVSPGDTSMDTIDHSTARLAVLIDADNAQPLLVAPLLAEVAKYGTAHVKRAYGDWTGTGLRGWKERLLAQSIQPIQQFAYTTGKNATDAALIIDAMDLLYTARFDGFCIVSSDSDFTRLASRIRESGLTVYGFGERKTPQSFVAACDKFIYTENLPHDLPTAQAQPFTVRPPTTTPTTRLEDDAALLTLLYDTVEAASGEDGWAYLATVGHLLIKRRPDFDPRTYGYTKLTDLVAAISLFEVHRRLPGDGKPAVVYVRGRRPGTPSPTAIPASRRDAANSITHTTAESD